MALGLYGILDIIRQMFSCFSNLKTNKIKCCNSSHVSIPQYIMFLYSKEHINKINNIEDFTKFISTECESINDIHNFKWERFSTPESPIYESNEFIHYITNNDNAKKILLSKTSNIHDFIQYIRNNFTDIKDLQKFII